MLNLFSFNADPAGRSFVGPPLVSRRDVEKCSKAVSVA